MARSYFFVSNWAWYEWLGALAPLALLWICALYPPTGARPPLAGLLRNLVRFGIVFTIGALVLNVSPRFENYTRLQPMRAFHILYVVMFLVIGALAGEYVLRDRTWRWLALFAPLMAGLWLADRDSFPASPHIEWPGAPERGNWYSAFQWVREHTPRDAVFAMDPGYLKLPGEDMHGFRAIAERSALADRLKDSGAVSLFPRLAGEWAEEVEAERGLAGLSLIHI